MICIITHINLLKMKSRYYIHFVQSFFITDLAKDVTLVQQQQTSVTDVVSGRWMHHHP